MPDRIARIVSIIGHPLLSLPAAALLLAASRGAGGTRLALLALAMATVGIAVTGYSRWQVQRRQWQHVDASGRVERRSLSRFLLVLCAVAAVLAWTLSRQQDLAIGLALSAGLVAVAMLLARWCKLSLHVAFAMYAAFLLAQLSWLACAAGIAFTAAVSWSRLALGRHAPRDLVAGALAGGLAGAAFWWLAGMTG